MTTDLENLMRQHDAAEEMAANTVALVTAYRDEYDAIAIARLSGKERNFTGEHFWARGYAVSTVGFELEQVRTYIREQETADGAAGQF